MNIQHLKLLNYRTYEKLDLTFSPSMNIIYGNNGVGKTNLIESIYVLALTKSFRGIVDKVLIMNNKEFTKIVGKVENKYVDEYKIIINDKGKKVNINGNNIPKLSDYISKINIVLFNPDDLRFIKDIPATRRKYINLDISQINNSYLKNLNSYNKLLKQRNMYLKNMYVNSNKSKDYLKALTEKLVDYGINIYKFRKKYVEMLNNEIKDIYYKICGIDNLRIVYNSSYNNLSKEELLAKYEDNLEKDILFGVTNFSLNHDDIVFYMGDYNIKNYGSEGQQKNAIIAYKFALINIIHNIKGVYPILILDDLFSELDRSKINNILKFINKNIQTFITTTEIDKLNKDLLSSSKKFEILRDGKIREVI